MADERFTSRYTREQVKAALMAACAHAYEIGVEHGGNAFRKRAKGANRGWQQAVEHGLRKLKRPLREVR